MESSAPQPRQDTAVAKAKARGRRRHHAFLVLAVCAGMVTITAIVLWVLAQMKRGPFKHWRMVTDPLHDERIIQAVAEARHGGPVTLPTKVCLDPNGFAGTFVQLPSIKGNTQREAVKRAKICQPCWDAATNQFKHGVTTVPHWWLQQQPACKDIYSGGSGTQPTSSDEKAQRCYARLCGLAPATGGGYRAVKSSDDAATHPVPTSAFPVSVGCMRSYQSTDSGATTSSVGAAAGAGWCTSTDASDVATCISCAESTVCNAYLNGTSGGVVVTKPTTAADGTLQFKLPCATAYMTGRFNKCVNSALQAHTQACTAASCTTKPTDNDVEDAVALCSSLVLQVNDEHPVAGSVTFEDWQQAQEQLRQAASGKCAAPSHGGVASPCVTKDGQPTTTPAGMCVRACNYAYGEAPPASSV